MAVSNGHLTAFFCGGTGVVLARIMMKSTSTGVTLAILGVLSFLVLAAVPLQADAGSAETPAPAVRGDTVLHCNDTVRITVYGEDDLTTEARIAKDGTIRFPLLGSVVLAGKTVEEATEDIRSALGQSYIRNPQVTLMVSAYAKETVTVLGQVKNPGEVQIPDEGGLDLLGAVALAGGFTDIAETSHIRVRRLVDGKTQIMEVNGKSQAGDSQAKPFYVEPGDTITVPERMF